MATPPTLPARSTARYHELFNALANDDVRRGYLLFHQERYKNITGAAVISRFWNKLTPEQQAEFINRATIPESSHGPDGESGQESDDGPEDESGEESDDSLLKDIDVARQSGREKARPMDLDGETENVEAPEDAAAHGADDKEPEYEPSEDEIEIARVGLTAALTGKVPPPPTRKRGRDEAPDDTTQTWRWCKTLMDSHTRFSGAEQMRTVVCLYALCDDTNIIVARKVCKKVRCGSQRTVDNVEDEYDTSQQLEICDHCHHIQMAFQQDGTLTYRLYSDYAEHGDLRNLLDIYYQEENLEHQIPEQFIWMVFHAIADAICTLNTGECGETLDEEKAAKEREHGGEAGDVARARKGKRSKRKPRKAFNGGMVHLDIKPENIFLDTAREPYLAYPRPILADFDVVKMIGEKTNRSEERKDWGTKNFQAPEVVVEALHHHSLDAKADIWSLGMLMWRMMHTTLGRERSDQICEDSIKASFQFADGYTFTSTDIPGYDAMYSNALHRLVIDCLQINPEKRPGYETLRKKAKGEYAKSQRRLGQVQSETKDGNDIADHLRVLHGEELKYRLGEKFQEPSRKKRKSDALADEDDNL